MSQKDSDLINQRLARITKYIECTQHRGEQAEEKYLVDWLKQQETK